jgi:hypothetical protein
VTPGNALRLRRHRAVRRNALIDEPNVVVVAVVDDYAEWSSLTRLPNRPYVMPNISYHRVMTCLPRVICKFAGAQWKANARVI